MPKRLPIVITKLLLYSLTAYAQFTPELPGSQAAALGNAAVTLENLWAAQNNIGALSLPEAPAVAFGYNTRFHLQELTTFGCIAAVPFKQGVFAASFSRFGTGAYSIQEIGLGYSHQVSYMSVGIKGNYLQQSIEGIGSQGAFVLEAGGKARLLPKLHFAAHVYNLSQSRINRHSKELIPLILKTGLAYLPVENVQLLVQTLKDLDHPSRFSAGLEFGIVETLHLRTGLMTRPAEVSFGLGFSPKNFCFDYAFRHLQTIGAAHHISIGYSFSGLK